MDLINSINELVIAVDYSQIEKFRVKITDEIPMPEIVLSICDVNGENKRMVMTRENISCVTAQAKVGKTFLIKLILSAILKRGLFQNRLLSELPVGKDKILYTVIYISVFFELFLPYFSERFVGDWRDVIMYCMGGFTFFLLQKTSN